MYNILETKHDVSINSSTNYNWIWTLPVLPKIKGFVWLLKKNDYLPKNTLNILI